MPRKKQTDVPPSEPATDGTPAAQPKKEGKRAQSPIPKFSLRDSIRVAQVIEDTNAGQPLPPVETALALDLSPRNAKFERLTSASIKYGLTTGSSRSDELAVTELGQRIVAPTGAEDRARALLKAALSPETFSRMYDFYKGKKLPEAQFLLNTIVREFDIPREHAQTCAETFIANMEFVGLVKSRGNDKYLSTQAKPTVSDIDLAGDDEDEAEDFEERDELPEELHAEQDEQPRREPPPNERRVNRKVFISHGKNRRIVDQVKEIVTFGDFEPVVSVENETASKPVPDKVMDDMRGCGAGIINVGTERKVIDQEGKEHVILNQNVLIEIGAAMALYERRFILLVEKGVDLPSNLQGLYQVRYEGDELGGDATMKLLKAFNDFKK
jgi:hypothetical protein